MRLKKNCRQIKMDAIVSQLLSFLTYRATHCSPCDDRDSYRVSSTEYVDNAERYDWVLRSYRGPSPADIDLKNCTNPSEVYTVLQQEYANKMNAIVTDGYIRKDNAVLVRFKSDDCRPIQAWVSEVTATPTECTLLKDEAASCPIDSSIANANQQFADIIPVDQIGKMVRDEFRKCLPPTIVLTFSQDISDQSSGTSSSQYQIMVNVNKSTRTDTVDLSVGEVGHLPLITMSCKKESPRPLGGETSDTSTSAESSNNYIGDLSILLKGPNAARSTIHNLIKPLPPNTTPIAEYKLFSLLIGLFRRLAAVFRVYKIVLCDKATMPCGIFASTSASRGIYISIFRKIIDQPGLYTKVGFTAEEEDNSYFKIIGNMSVSELLPDITNKASVHSVIHDYFSRLKDPLSTFDCSLLERLSEQIDKKIEKERPNLLKYAMHVSPNQTKFFHNKFQ